MKTPTSPNNGFMKCPQCGENELIYNNPQEVTRNLYKIQDEVYCLSCNYLGKENENVG